MFELERKFLFFESMAAESPPTVQNIEIVHENKKLLDIAYHNPKLFILNLNNLLRALMFFVEGSIKNSPSWLCDCVKAYKAQNYHEYEILKKLRDVSAHQSLIVPKESFTTGLYRVRSAKEYVLKIGMGDRKAPVNYSWDLAMKNTDEIFHDLLAFHHLTFMDIEHSSLNECLGITRKWFFKVKFKNKHQNFDETVDVYSLICNFSGKLLDAVCQAFADSKKIVFESPFHYEAKEFNCINTLLELDLYPSLFCEWWEDEIKPINYGIRVQKHLGEKISHFDILHKLSFDEICKSPEEYKAMLIKYSTLPVDDFFNKENLAQFYSFLYFNHWHFKKAFNANLMNTPIEFSQIMMFQRIGKIFIGEYEKEKQCTINSSEKAFKDHIEAMLKKI